MVRAFVVVAGVLALAPDAHADGGFSIGSRPTWFVTGGATAGATVAFKGRGAFVGGELSLVRVRDQGFVGLYADAYYDFAADGTFATFGPELGRIHRSPTLPLALGVDGGAAFRFSDESVLGATGRVFVSMLGTFSLFGRYAYFEGGEHVLQVGITMKLPLARPFGAGAR